MNYNYDFQNEKIAYEAIDVITKFNNKDMRCNIIKTDRNLLFFLDDSKDHILKAGRLVQLPAQNELIYKVDLQSLKAKVEDNNTIITTADGEIIVIGIDLLA